MLGPGILGLAPGILGGNHGATRGHPPPQVLADTWPEIVSSCGRCGAQLRPFIESTDTQQGLS